MEWAQQRDVEAGVLIRGAHVVRQLRARFDALVEVAHALVTWVVVQM
jgi:phosphatidylserine/phosphatidylglycerophosphate/cardiolipin synthase-like enzyme